MNLRCCCFTNQDKIRIFVFFKHYNYFLVLVSNENQDKLILRYLNTIIIFGFLRNQDKIILDFFKHFFLFLFQNPVLQTSYRRSSRVRPRRKTRVSRLASALSRRNWPASARTLCASLPITTPSLGDTIGTLWMFWKQRTQGPSKYKITAALGTILS